MIEGSIRETIEIVMKVRVIEETIDQGMIIEIHLEMIGGIMTETVMSLIGIMTDNEVEMLIEEIGMVIGIEGDRICIHSSYRTRVILPLWFLINSSIWFDAMSLECFILNVKGFQVRNSIHNMKSR